MDSVVELDRVSRRYGSRRGGVTALREVTRLRRERVGFVLQSYNLLSELSVRQNVLLPSRLGAPSARPLRRGPIAATRGSRAHTGRLRCLQSRT